MVDDKKTIETLKEYISELELELKRTKKYGLVWDKEHTKEDVVKECETNIPLLKEDVSASITNGGGIIIY